MLFLEQFWNISKSRKNLSFFNFEMLLSASYLYFLGEYIIKGRDCSVGKHFKTTLKNVILANGSYYY